MRWVMPYIDEVTWARWDGLAAFAPKPVVVLAGLLAGMSVFCLTPFTLFLYAIFIAVVDLVQDRDGEVVARIFLTNMETIGNYFHQLFLGLIILGVLGLCFALLRRRTLLSGQYLQFFRLSVSWEGLLATAVGYVLYFWFAVFMEVPGLLTQGVWLFVFSGPLLNWYLRTVHSLLLVLISGRSWEFSSEATARMLLIQKLSLGLDQINLVRAHGDTRQLEVDADLDATDLRRAEDLLLSLPRMRRVKLTSPFADLGQLEMQSGQAWRSLAQTRQARRY